MPQFKMQGKIITGYSMFLKYFSPEDVLRQRELAAGFIYQHMMLSPADEYHCKVFYNAALNENGCEQMLAWKKYYSLRSGIRNTIRHKDQTLIKGEIEKQKTANGEIIEKIWDLSHKNGLSPRDQERLFCMLTASYSLADLNTDTKLISAQDAERAFLRKPKNTEDELTWIHFSNDGEIRLAARNKPYRIMIGTGAGKFLSDGRTISLRKILAIPHPQGIGNMSVTLEIYHSEQDEEPALIEKLNPGEYRYVNCINDTPVYIHPAEGKLQTSRFRRERNRIVYFDGKAEHSQAIVDGENDIVGFAIAPNDMGYLLLYSDSSPSDFGYALKITNRPLKDIVQLAFRAENGECLMLSKYGQVYSNLMGWLSDTKVAELGEHIRGDGNCNE